MMDYSIYRLTQMISRALPRRFAYWIGLRVADRFFAHDERGRLAVMSNYRHILEQQGIQPSEDTLRRMARGNFQHFGKYLVDFFKFARFDLKDVNRLVSIEHLDRLEEAERLGKGVVLITAHIGNWELGGAVLTALGRRVHAVFYPQRVGKVNELFQKHRVSRGLRLIPFGQAARGALRALRERECVAMLADRDYTTHSDDAISFFGRSARLPSGPARIAFKTGAPIVPMFLVRQEDDTFRLRIHPPIMSGPPGGVLDIRRAIRDIIEAEIARAPLQWFIFDDFWQPERLHENF